MPPARVRALPSGSGSSTAVAPSEGAEKSGGLGGGERQEDVVAVAHQRGRLLGTAQSGSMVFGHDGSIY